MPRRLEPDGSGPDAARTSADHGAATRAMTVAVGSAWSVRGTPGWPVGASTGRPRGRTTAYSWRGRRETAGCLLQRTVISDHGNRPVRLPPERGQRRGSGWVHRRPKAPGGAEPP